MDRKKQRIWHAAGAGALTGVSIRFRQTAAAKRKKPHNMLRRMLLISIPLISVIVSAAYVFNFNSTHNLSYAFSGTETCTQTNVLLPGLHSFSTNTNDFTITPASTTSLFGTDIISKQLCFTAQNEPKANTLYNFSIAHNVLGFINKDVRLVSQAQPEIIDAPDTDKTIPIAGTIDFALDSEAADFNYEIHANGRSTICTPATDSQSDNLSCLTEPLQLKQSQQYSFVLMRNFADFELQTPVFNGVYTTAEAVEVVDSSIADQHLFFSKPDTAVITFNKSIATVGDISLVTKSTDQEHNITTSIDDKKLTVSFEQQLPREQEFVLRIDNATSEDNGWLQEPYTLSFSTSGGPKVIGNNLEGHAFGQSEDIVLTFDSELRDQDVSSFVSIRSDDQIVDAVYSVSGANVTISPQTSFAGCQAFTVSVSSGLVSSYGIASADTFTQDARTACYTTERVGTSEQGRPITAFVFGSGPEVVMFTGGTHGSEPSSTYILDSFVNDLNQDFSKIPSDTTVIVVPSINPDGILAGSRENAAGVDLNRNFPANNWKKDVIVPGGSTSEGGGGSEPLDQAESAAIANYTLSKNPKIVVNYHAVGGLSISNGSGDSVSRAKTYASTVGYTYLTSEASNAVFSHDTTGAYSDWLHDKAGIPAILVELQSFDGNEFSTHRSAMWAVIQD